MSMSMLMLSVLFIGGITISSWILQYILVIIRVRVRVLLISGICIVCFINVLCITIHITIITHIIVYIAITIGMPPIGRGRGRG